MYSIGSIADLISGKNTPNKPSVKVKQFKTKPNKNIDASEAKEETPAKSPKKKNAKTVSKPEQLEAKTEEKQFKKSNKRKLNDDSNTDEASKKRKLFFQQKHGDDNLKFKPQTIFVGNVPLNTDSKRLSNFFSKYGEILTVRFRGVPVADPKMSKKVALIKKKFHPNRKSLQAYIVFKDVDSVDGALQANGAEFMGHHLRVDRLDATTEHDNNKAIFIGNLPFQAEEDDLWQLFEPCGEIASVRIVRDPLTQIGKGFAYVNFTSADAVELALQMEDLVVGKRQVRVERCSAQKKKTTGGQKIRKVPRPQKHVKHTKKSNVKSQKKGEKQEKDSTVFQGAKFTDKKKKKKLNKDELKKKKFSKMLTPKSKKE